MINSTFRNTVGSNVACINYTTLDCLSGALCVSLL